MTAPPPPLGSPAPSAGRRLAFRPDLEGLRAVAILLVVASHADVPGLAGGYVGVDVFFVLSGFLITSLLLGEIAATGTIGIAAFYARRIRRLLPAASVALLGTLLLAVVAWPPDRVAGVARTAIAAAASVGNIVFARRATDYFADADPDPLLHTWSLAVEEQFYLVWPLLLLAAAGRAGNRRRIAGALGLMFVVSLAACWYWTIARQPTAFYGSPFRAWEFAVGAALALIPAGMIGRHPRSARALGWLGLAMVLGAAVAFDEHTDFPGTSALLPVLGTAAIIAASGALGRVLTAAPMQWIGRHSYSWYLWHWPAIIIGGGLLGTEAVPAKLALALGALALAMATRRYVEVPVQRWRAAVVPPRRVVLAGIGAIAVVAAGAAALAGQADRAAESPLLRAFSASRFDFPQVTLDRCAVNELGEAKVRICRYGPPGAPVRVALLGDSHAAHWAPALEQIARVRGWELVVLVKAACPAADVALHEGQLRRRFHECAAWRSAAIDSIRALRPGLVLVASSTEYVIGGPGDQRRSSVTAAEWEAGLERTLARLNAAGLRTTIIADSPTARENVPACLTLAAWRGRPLAECDFTPADAFHDAVIATEQRIVRRSPLRGLIDLSGVFCANGRCPVMDRGVVRYRDNRHLSATGSRLLAGHLDRALTPAVAPAPLAQGGPAR